MNDNDRALLAAWRKVVEPDPLGLGDDGQPIMPGQVIRLSRPALRPLVDRFAELADAITYDRLLLEEVLIGHQRLDSSRGDGCSCGEATWGASFAEHITDVYEVQWRRSST